MAKEVTKKEKSEVVAVPDFMKGLAGEGTELISAQDVEVPRLQLLQSLSPQVVEGDEVAGVFYHSIAEEALDKNLKIIPVWTDIRYILWRPRHDGGGILARSDDGKTWQPANAKFEVNLYKGQKKTAIWDTKNSVQESGLTAWGSYDPENEESQPAATKMYNIVAYLPDYPEYSPCVITLQRGAVRVARKFMGKLKLSQAPSYGQIFNVNTVVENTGEGDFYNPTFERAGFVQDEALFKELKEMYETFSSLGLNIRDVEGLQDEAVASDDDDSEDAIST